MLSCNVHAEAHSLTATLCRAGPSIRPLTHSSSTSTALPPRPPRSAPLAGTVPYHLSYLFLHAPDHASKWPARFTSHVYLELQRQLKVNENPGLVNFCWHGEKSHAGTAIETEEAYRATLWKKSRFDEISRRFEIPIVSTRTLEKVVSHSLQQDTAESNYDEAVNASGPYFYVCTHGKRDCRCGTRGGQLFRDLQKELHSRGMLFDEDGKPRLGEVGHVGGHKNAPNLLVFPQGDWYGNLEAADLPALIDHYVQCLKERRESPSSMLTGPNRFQWRGRMGMTKQEQSNMFHGHVWVMPVTAGFLLE